MGEKLLQGKNALITGTRRGMGREMLRLLAENGANVWAHARQETPEFLADIEELARETGVTIRPLCFELTDSEAMKAAVKTVYATKEPVDILVNNAGISHTALFQMCGMNTLREEFDVNFFAVYELTQYIAKVMVRNKCGSIINIASTAALDANKGKAAYASAKAALVCLSRVIAAELGASGVRCNCVAPGITDTELLKTTTEKSVQDTIDNTVMKRLGLPSEIAETVLFLASDRSRYVTGQVLRVDGGLVREP